MDLPRVPARPAAPVRCQQSRHRRRPVSRRCPVQLRDRPAGRLSAATVPPQARCASFLRSRISNGGPVAWGGDLRPDPERNRLPRRPAGRLSQRAL